MNSSNIIPGKWLLKSQENAFSVLILLVG